MMDLMEDKLQHNSQYIDMDLALHIRASEAWENGASTVAVRLRNLHQSSFEEFDFTKCGMYMKDVMCEQAVDVAPADEIFFRGQLLPLQQDPRLHLVQTLTCNTQGDMVSHVDSGANMAAGVFTNQGHLLQHEYVDEKKRFIDFNQEKFTLAACVDQDGLVIPISAREEDNANDTREEDDARVSTTKCVHNEDELPSRGFAAKQGANVPPRSSRSDGIFDGFRNDSRSSSFRSQQSSCWSNGDKDSRDSSSSSRCSNGSSQDSCFQNGERKPTHQALLMGNPGVSNAKGKSTIFEVNSDFENQSKAPIACSSHNKTKKWSWKGIFNGLRKATKIWVDDKPHSEQRQHNTQVQEASKHKKSVFQFKTPSFSQQRVSSNASGHDNEAQDVNTRFYVGATGMGYYEARQGKDKTKSWSVAKDSWQRCVNKVAKMKSGKLFVHPKGNMMDEDIRKFDLKAKSLSTTPLAKSPVRRCENVDLNIDYGFSLNGNNTTTTTSSSSKYVNLGFVSCPASMRSSPHHSGVLAVVNKQPPLSSLQDLHTAIQGAIAHCKESQSVKLL